MKISDFTVKEIMDNIKEAAETINRRKKEYVDSGEEIDYDYETHFERLKTRSFSSMKHDNEYDADFVNPNIYGRIKDPETGVLRKKNKQELYTQMRDLQTFVNLDAYTPEGREIWSGKGTNLYKVFLKHYKLDEEKFTLQDYTNMVGQMEKIKNEIETYGYEEKGANVAYVNAYLSKSKDNRNRFFDVIEDSYKSLKKKGISTPTYKSILKEAKTRFKRL